MVRHRTEGEATAPTSLQSALDAADSAARVRALIDEIYPICRSITGEGVRATLDIVGRDLRMGRHEVPSGTSVLDWTVPNEWNVRDAYIARMSGERVVDFAESNLHLMSYSTPFRGVISREELDQHLFSLPDRPDWVPYRTSYYLEAWGFCLSERTRSRLTDDRYEVSIDTTLAEGSLTYGELLLPGDDEAAEILLTTHVCHPALANDNCSGIAILAEAGRLLARAPRRFSYRLLFIPGTIGSITWLARNERAVKRIRHGIVLTGLGDPGPLTWKRTRRGATAVDRAASHVLAHCRAPTAIVDFSPYGYDERQFCSPGFDLPVGRLSRTPHGEYPEYHTSADDLSFIRDDCLVESLGTLLAILDVLEGDGRYVNTHPQGEPQLGRRGLYRSLGGAMDRKAAEMSLLWVLNQSDGTNSLLDIADRARQPFASVRAAADSLLATDLLVEAPHDHV